MHALVGRHIRSVSTLSRQSGGEGTRSALLQRAKLIAVWSKIEAHGGMNMGIDRDVPLYSQFRGEMLAHGPVVCRTDSLTYTNERGRSKARILKSLYRPLDAKLSSI